MAALHLDATPYAVARTYTTLLDTTEIRLGPGVLTELRVSVAMKKSPVLARLRSPRVAR